MLKRPGKSDSAPSQEPQARQQGIGALIGALPSLDEAGAWTPKRRKDGKQGPPFEEVGRAIRLDPAFEKARDDEIDEQIRLCEQGSYEDQLRVELELDQRVQAEEEEIAAAVAHVEQDGGNRAAEEKAKLAAMTEAEQEFLSGPVPNITKVRYQTLKRMWLQAHAADFTSKEFASRLEENVWARNHCSQLTEEELEKVLAGLSSCEDWVNLAKMTELEKKALRYKYLTMRVKGAKKSHVEFLGTHLMTTYNHAAWVWPLPKDDFGEDITDIAQCAQKCRKGVTVQEIWTQIRDGVVAFAQKHHVLHYSVSQEICPDTLEQTGMLRLHHHVVFDWGTKNKWHCRNASAALTFNDVAPGHLRKGDEGQGHRRQTSDPMHYYLQFPKYGLVQTDSNYWAHKDFCASPKWITSYLTRRKLDWLDAEKEYVYACGNLRNNLSNLRLYSEQMRKIMMEEKKKAYLECLKKSQVGFVPVPAAIAFQKQFLRPTDRAMPLVLDGETRCGKTIYAQWFCRDPENCLILNSSALTEPDLRPFEEGKHLVILFDELHPATMAQYRKVFQCPAHDLTLGQSATNTFTYSRWIAGTRMIVAANAWSESLIKMEQDGKGEDVHWIRNNTFHARIEEGQKLYWQDGDDRSDPRLVIRWVRPDEPLPWRQLEQPPSDG